MTKREIASRLGIDPALITRYEDATRVPTEETIAALCDILEFPRKYFFAQDIEAINPEAVSFRALRSITAALRDKTVASGTIAHEIVSPEFRRRFDLPEVDIPELPGEEPELAAKIIRRHWRLADGPIGNMVHLLEGKGVEVYWVKDAVPCIDAVSAWWNDKPIVVMNVLKGQKKRPGSRQRFDAAHELGHLVLHRNADRLDSHKVEAEANAFASAFLLPEDAYRDDCPKYPIPQLFFPLKAEWKVSIQAMIRRGYTLGIFKEWQYERACKEISILGYRAEEPGEFDAETSIIQATIYDSLGEDGETLTGFADALGLSERDLVELTPDAGRLPKVQPTPWPVLLNRPQLRLVSGGQ